MKVTLGGDRISSGKKMQVKLHAYQRSSHDRGYIWKNTASPGTVIPFMIQVGTPGSTFDIDLDCEVLTHPTIGPLFGSFKLDLHVFQAPVRLYHAWLHNNKLNIGRNMSTVKLPILTLGVKASALGPNAQFDNQQINPSCLLAYLGIRGIGFTDEETERSFNGLPFLMYWDIIKNYYTNKQEEEGAYIRGLNAAIIETIDAITIDGTTVPEGSITTPVTPSFGEAVVVTYTGTPPDPTQITVRIVGVGGDRTVTLASLVTTFVDTPGVSLDGTWTFSNGGISVLYWNYETNTDIPLQPPIVDRYPLDHIDQMREAILASSGIAPFDIKDAAAVIGSPYLPILTVEENGRNPRLNTQEGLAVKTYQSDLFNNWLNTEWIDDVNTNSAIQITGGAFTIDQLNFKKKQYKLENRIGVSGGTYKDWMETVYTHINFQQTEIPVYWGGLIKELVFQEITSNSAATTGDTSQPLGTLAGKGRTSNKHKGGKIRVKLDEMSYVIGLFSITPRIEYSQGNSWDCLLQTMDDFHKPEYDEIGFQELPTEQMASWATVWDGTAWIQTSAGKQPAWTQYMTEVNKSYGNFAIPDNEMFMTLNRRYERGDGNIADLTTYIDPVKYNYIFADTSLDAMNFWVNIAVDMTYRGKMSGKLMPMP